MKNTAKHFGIIAFIAIIGFLLASCDLFDSEQESKFEGKQESKFEGKWGFPLSNQIWTFQNNNFSYTTGNYTPGGGGVRGTFTYTNTHITFNAIEIRLYDYDNTIFIWREIHESDNLNSIGYFRNNEDISYNIHGSGNNQTFQILGGNFPKITY